MILIWLNYIHNYFKNCKKSGIIFFLSGQPSIINSSIHQPSKSQFLSGSSDRLDSVTVDHLRNLGYEVTDIDLIEHSSTDELMDILALEAIERITKT